MDFILLVLKQYGPTAALLAFFIWRDYIREKNMTRNIKELDLELRNVLKNLVEKTTRVLIDNTNAMREISKAIFHIPCFYCTTPKKSSVPRIEVQNDSQNKNSRK